jgi:hypothetical protein
MFAVFKEYLGQQTQLSAKQLQLARSNQSTFKQ